MEKKYAIKWESDTGMKGQSEFIFTHEQVIRECSRLNERYQNIKHEFVEQTD